MNRVIKRFLPVALILIAMAVMYFSGAYRYLSIDNLKTHHKELKTFIAAHPILMPTLFILTYIFLTAVSVPGGAVLSLLGGYLFPQPLSTVYVIFSATCGASLIFLAAKTALGDSLKKRAGPLLKKMEKGFQKNAASYLLFLRFVPLFPFWLVNLAPAFFGVSLGTFIWTTALGITPGSFVFTLVGSGLGEIFASDQPFSIGAIFNNKIKIALILLGLLALLPILLKRKKKHD